MADRSLLELSSLAGEDDETVRPLEYLYKDDHLFVFEQVESTSFIIDGVFKHQLSDLLIELTLHGLEKVTVTDLTLEVG